MFDFRYHALSLSAVIVALVLGVLLGVAIGDRGLVSSAEKGLRANLRSDVVAARHHADELQGELNDRNAALNEVYPLLVDNRLAGRDLGVVYLGAKSTTAKNLVTKAIDHTGANLAWLFAFREPLDAAAIAAHTKGTQYEELANNPKLYGLFGFRVGTQLVTGGKFVTREQPTLSDSFDGTLKPASAIVLVHDPPTDLTDEQAAAAQAFEDGVVKGMTAAGATVVGVQTQTTKPSQSKWYRDQGVSYVNDLDEVAGRIALIYGLAGASTGAQRLDLQQLLPGVTTSG